MDCEKHAFFRRHENICARVCMHVQYILYIHVNVPLLSSTLYRWNAQCRAKLLTLTERVSQEITVYYCIFILLHALLTLYVNINTAEKSMRNKTEYTHIKYTGNELQTLMKYNREKKMIQNCHFKLKSIYCPFQQILPHNIFHGNRGYKLSKQTRKKCILYKIIKSEF